LTFFISRKNRTLNPYEVINEKSQTTVHMFFTQQLTMKLFSLILMMNLIFKAMNVQSLFETLSPFARISSVNELFGKFGLNKYVGNELGMRSKIVRYQYSEIILNMTNGFLSG